MGKQITIKAGYSRVSLPNGKSYDSGQTAVLTDAEYARLTPRMNTYVNVGATVPDPIDVTRSLVIRYDTDGIPYIAGSQ